MSRIANNHRHTGNKRVECLRTRKYHRKYMGGMSAARANISDIRYTIQPTIPHKRNQKRGRPHNAALYRERRSYERFLCRLKQFRAVATRYDRTGDDLELLNKLRVNVIREQEGCGRVPEIVEGYLR